MHILSDGGNEAKGITSCEMLSEQHHVVAAASLSHSSKKRPKQKVIPRYGDTPSN